MSHAKPSADNSDHKRFLEALKAGRVKSVQIDTAALGAGLFQAFANFQAATGIRAVSPDVQSSIYCDVEFHFRRMTGTGSDLAYPLYTLSRRLAYKSGTFSLSLQEACAFLNVPNDHPIYPAAALIVRAGWWQVLEAELGKPVKYRPLSHDEWAEKFGVRCCIQKQEGFPYKDDTETAQLGRELHAVFGGGRLHPAWLKSLRNTGATDDQIVTLAKEFMQQDGGKGDKMRFKRFHECLDRFMKKATSELPRS